MKLLLDECLPLDFRHSFTGHTAHTAQWAGLKGKKHGDLLRSAESAGYDVLITVDQGIPYQQSIGLRKISIVVLVTRTNQLEDLLPVVEHALIALGTLQPGEVVRIATQ